MVCHHKPYCETHLAPFTSWRSSSFFSAGSLGTESIKSCLFLTYILYVCPYFWKEGNPTSISMPESKKLIFKMTKTQMCVYAQSRLTLCGPTIYSLPGSSVHGIFPGKNTGVSCHFLFQGIFPTQALNLSPALAGRFLTT